MNSTDRPELGKGAKIFVGFAIALSIWCTADFLNDRRWHDLACGIGFALMAYGTYRNGHRKPPADGSSEHFDKLAYTGNAVGFVLVIASLVGRLWP